MSFRSFLKIVYAKIASIYIKTFNASIIFTDMFGLKFFLKKNDDIVRYMERGSITDATNIINYILKSKKNIDTQIDFGCNMGAVSAAMWSVTSSGGVVYSVEADPENVKRCQKNLELNSFSNSYVMNFAIAPHDGEIKLRIYDGINGWQTIFGSEELNDEYKSYFISVPAMTFKKFVECNEINNVDFMKIDIEGMEYDLLIQMHEFLLAKKVKEVIFELNQIALAPTGKTKEDVLKLWEQYDYQLYLINATGDISKLTPGIVPEEICCDILARAGGVAC